MPGTQQCSRRTLLEPGTDPAFPAPESDSVTAAAAAAAISGSDQRQRTGSAVNHQQPCPLPQTSGPHRGVPSLTLFLIRIHERTATRTMSRGATPAVHRPCAPLHATMQAADAPSAGSQPFNHPPRDRDDGATLGSLPTGGDSEGRRSGSSSIPVPFPVPFPMQRPKQRQRQLQRQQTAPAISYCNKPGRGSTPPLQRHLGTISPRATLQSPSSRERLPTQSDTAPVTPRPLSIAMALRPCVFAPLR
jgi:hypothetical protein